MNAAPPPAPATGRILVVEDEPRLAAVLQDYLRAAGHSSEWVADGAAVMDAFRSRQHELVLLDLMLPNVDGIRLCRSLRAESAVPIIMLTARVEEVDRLLGLEVGADDYICKPFSPREVVARVAAVLRRHRHTPAAAPTPLQIDADNGRIAWQGQWMDLTPVEYRLLATLASTPLRVWSRDLLMDHVYTDHRVVTDRTVDSHVRNLRRKLLEAGAGEESIRSIYGMGYRLEL